MYSGMQRPVLQIIKKDKKMLSLETIEKLNNAMDVGFFMQSVSNAFKKKMGMDFYHFLKHLIFGKGFKELTPPELIRQQDFYENELLIVDLRDHKSFKKGHIPNAVLHPFDDFIGDVLINGGYSEYKQKCLVLVCDTGAKSRVAASILAQEGFMKVSSLNRGMRRWARWEKLVKSCGQSRFKKFHLCRYISWALPVNDMKQAS